MYSTGKYCHYFTIILNGVYSIEKLNHCHSLESNIILQINYNLILKTNVPEEYFWTGICCFQELPQFEWLMFRLSQHNEPLSTVKSLFNLFAYRPFFVLPSLLLLKTSGDLATDMKFKIRCQLLLPFSHLHKLDFLIVVILLQYPVSKLHRE